MDWIRLAIGVGLLAAAMPCLWASDPPGRPKSPATTVSETAPAGDYNPQVESSSLAADNEDAEVPEMMLHQRRGDGSAKIAPLRVGVIPFTSYAIQLKLGLGGAGFDIATAVTSKMNLRVGGNFFSYNPSLTADGIDIIGNIQLQSITENFDFFPFGNAFRISPGITFYNGNHITAAAQVPGGQTFSLDNVQYISDPADPIQGIFDLHFGNQLAPSLTMGFGNMIPRRGGHWSVPVEIGAEYIGRKPVILLELAGSACQMSTAPSNCGSVVGDPETQTNLAGEQTKLNNDIPTQLRFFPVVSIGLSYRFGRPPGE